MRFWIRGRCLPAGELCEVHIVAWSLFNAPRNVDHLAERMIDRGLDVVVLKGAMGARSRAAAMRRLQPVEDVPPLLVVAKGHFVG